jgi:hypothetical protein
MDKLIDELEVTVRKTIDALQIAAYQLTDAHTPPSIRMDLATEHVYKAMALLRYIGVEDEPMS